MHLQQSVSMTQFALFLFQRSSAYLAQFKTVCSPFLCFFCSCYRPAVSLSRQPLGRAAQVQEGVGERHEVYRCVRRYQPRQCCILSPCPVHLSNALLLLLWLFVTVQWKSTPVINSILAAVCISSVICFILLQKEVVQLVGGQICVRNNQMLSSCCLICLSLTSRNTETRLRQQRAALLNASGLVPGSVVDIRPVQERLRTGHHHCLFSYCDHTAAGLQWSLPVSSPSATTGCSRKAFKSGTKTFLSIFFWGNKTNAVICHHYSFISYYTHN